MKFFKKVRQVGGSMGILFPKDILKYLMISKGDNVSIEPKEDYIIIRKVI